MQLHDFRLAGYSVLAGGSRVTLHLEYGYPGQPREESHIEFGDVAAYHFVHTGEAVITDIEEVPLADLLDSVGGRLAEWWRRHGALRHWSDDRGAYLAALEAGGYRSWEISSSVGFEGFVIAKRLGQKGGAAAR
jgi:hypothetical protein